MTDLQITPSPTPAAAYAGDNIDLLTQNLPPGCLALYTFSKHLFVNPRSVIEQVRTIQSAVGTSSLQSADATTSRPTVVSRGAGGAGAAVMSFDGLSSWQQFLTTLDPAVTPINATNRYEALILLRRHSENTGRLLQNSAAAATPGFDLQAVSSNGGYTLSVYNGAAAITNALAIPSFTNSRLARRKWHVLSMRGDGTNATLEIVGASGASASQAQAFSGAGSAANQLAIAAQFTGAAKWDPQIAAIAFWSRPLSTTERTAAASTLLSSICAPASGDMRVVTIAGDSVMAGQVAPTMWQALAPMLPTSRITQRAVSGTVISQIKTSIQDEGTIESPEFWIVQGGTNDIVGGASSATVIAAFADLCATAKALGGKVIAVTVAPGTDSTKTGAVNTAIRASLGTNVDAVADTNAILRLGGLAGTDEGAWNAALQSDSLHPNALGNRAMARVIADCIAGLS